nr:GON-4-like protein [Rhipicephalus microplus]
MPNSDDRPRRSTTGGPSTPGDSQVESLLPETPERPLTPDAYRRTPALDSAQLVICEQNASTVSDAPPDAEYVCIPSSDGEYRLQEITLEASSPQQDADGGLAAAPADTALESGPADATGEATTSTGQRGKRPREERKGKKKPKKPRTAPVQEPCETDLDKFLEDTAEKNNLTVTNVKNIIRRVVSNSRVLAMLQNTMISHVAAEEMGTDLSSLPYEPKFTRAKAREIMEKQPHLLWQVSPMKLSAPSGSQQLLQHEFPDESSSDEEYHPASEESEDDITEPPSSVASSVPFSPPASDAVQESPEKQDPSDAGAESGIAERTRSKLPLHDTPLECIEAQFIAPDITTDMYDTECDDEEWKEFLVSLVKPFEQEDNHEDDVEDPEYTVQDEEEENFDSWDVRNDQAVRIPQQEVSDLMTELMQAATRELLDNEEEEDALLVAVKPSPAKSATASAASLVEQSEADIFQEATESVQDEIFAQPTPRQIQQLEEQMRMHVQLLAQMCLLCSNNEHLSKNFDMAKTLLKELGIFASRPLPPPKKQSLFNTCNLPQAIRMLESLPQRPPVATPVKGTSNSARKKKMRGQVPSHARDILLDSPVFIYPDLLPTSRMYSPLHDPFKKVIFFPSEDHLLALGLEQFVPPRSCSFSSAYLRLIRTFLLPVKTEIQIKVHVKNIIYKKIGVGNPIKYWHIHKVAPPLVWEPHPIELRSLVPPSKRPLEILPMWMQVQLSLRPTRRVTPPLSGTPTPPPPIRPASSTPPTAATVVCPSSGLLAIGSTVVVSPATATAPATLTVVSPTTPRHTVVSPLKQISPILKKYSQYGRKILLKTPVKKRLSYEKEPAPSASTAPVQNSSALPERTSSADAVSQPADTSARAPRKETLPAAASEEAEDNEGDLAALMAASSTILRRKQALSRKRSRQQKDAEATLPLLVPGLVDSDPLKDERENQFTQQYLNRVQEALKDDEARHKKFIDLMKTAHCDQVNPVELYKNIEELLHDHQDLVDDFVGFLLPEQALQCGKLLQYLNFRKIQLFLRKLEVHLGQQPQQLQRLMRSLHQLQRQSELTAETIFSVLQPLLRGQSHLIDELQQLLPSQGVPDSLMEDFEEVTLPEEEEEEDEEEGAAGSPGGAGSSCEELTLSPPRDTPGTPQCPCTCHQRSTDPRFLSRTRHCTRCGIKFLDGRVFLQTGKVLRPARVTIGRPQSPEMDSNTSESQMSEKHAEASKSALGKDGDKMNNREGQSITWKREDDKVLLQACQQLGTEKGLQRASQTLGRPPEQVTSRFQELIRLFEASKSDDEADS